MNPSNNIATIARVRQPDFRRGATHPQILAVDDARRLLLSDDPADVLQIEGSFALFARDGQKVWPRPQPRPAAALLPGEGTGRPHAGGGGPYATPFATRWSARGTAISSIRPTPAWFRPITSPKSSSWAAPIPIRPNRRFFDPPRGILPPTSTPSARPTSAPSAKRFASGSPR